MRMQRTDTLMTSMISSTIMAQMKLTPRMAIQILASFHAHDVNATSCQLIANVSVDSAVPQHSHSHIPPPYSRLPDNIVAPLYRPPIA